MELQPHPQPHTPCDLCGGEMNLGMPNSTYQCNACGWSRDVHAGDFMDEDTRMFAEQMHFRARNMKIIHVASTQAEWRRVVEARRRRSALKTYEFDDDVPF